jgi:hypothetical protein
LENEKMKNFSRSSPALGFADPNPMRHRKGHDDNLTYMSMVVASEIMLVCATVLVLFVYLNLPIPVATGLSLAVILAGSALCWKSLSSAEAVFIASVVAVEVVLMGYFPGLIVVFVLADILIIIWMSTLWNVRETA